MNRRVFVQHAAVAAVAAGFTAGGARAGAASARKWSTAIIGHTGRGNYGHSLDLVFNDRDECEIAAVADPDTAGRTKAQARIGALRAYADYREMLQKERPALVCVAPRLTDQHHAMVKAALAIGAHVYCEKPFTRTLAEADDLLALARSTGRKIAVAHQGRVAPSTLHLKRRLDDGLIGELLEIRIHGKQDRRAGGEDMVVLGTHQFDLARFFLGDPRWCTARVLHQGRDITRADARAATEDIGPVAGDEITALFAFSNGANVHYTSRARNAATAGPWGMEFIGSKGRVKLLNDIPPQVFLWEHEQWRPLPDDPATGANEIERGFVAANRRVVDDWLAAIREEREPACSGHAAMKSLEMIHAVFAAGLSRERVPLPLVRRAHPLG